MHYLTVENVRRLIKMREMSGSQEVIGVKGITEKQAQMLRINFQSA